MFKLYLDTIKEKVMRKKNEKQYVRSNTIRAA